MHPSGSPIYAEELYDHHGEELGGLTLYENENVASKVEYASVLMEQREMLLDWIANKAVFKNGHHEDYMEAKEIFFSNITDYMNSSSPESNNNNNNNNNNIQTPFTGQMYSRHNVRDRSA